MSAPTTPAPTAAPVATLIDIGPACLTLVGRDDKPARELVYRLVRQRVLPAVRLGARRVMFSPQALSDFVARGGNRGADRTLTAG